MIPGIVVFVRVTKAPRFLIFIVNSSTVRGEGTFLEIIATEPARINDLEILFLLLVL